MKVAFLTLGCRTNQAESLSLEHALHEQGHQIVDLSEHPDICIINTCTVTAKADYQSRQLINRALKNNAKVIVTGCYSELHPDTAAGKGEDVEIVRNADKFNIIKRFSHAGQTIALPVKRDFRHRPSVKVQDGCNYACSYCAIPSARGRSRSIFREEVIEQINHYHSMGYHEVVLTGIHLGTYGMDLSPKLSLSGLLATILNSTKIERIRLSSIEAKEIDEALLELFTDRRICNHLHVPLQSGSDTVLKLMNRTYSASEYRACIERILKRIPDIGLGTDVIAGFPGEGEAEFSAGIRLIEAIPFTYLHVFPYSRRPWTKAAAFPQQVPDRVKKQRAAELRTIGARKKKEYIEKNIKKSLDIIIEEQHGDKLIGTTRSYIKAFLPVSSGAFAGNLVNIEVSGYQQGMAAGIRINS